MQAPHKEADKGWMEGSSLMLLSLVIQVCYMLVISVLPLLELIEEKHQ